MNQSTSWGHKRGTAKHCVVQANRKLLHRFTMYSLLDKAGAEVSHLNNLFMHPSALACTSIPTKYSGFIPGAMYDWQSQLRGPFQALLQEPTHIT